MHPKRRLAASLLAATLLAPFVLAQSPAAPDWDTLGAAWWAHVQYLASDELEGRQPGHPGFELATQYVVKQFTAIGLKPAGGSQNGPEGYLQQFNLSSTKVDTEHSLAELKTSAGVIPLKLGTEITLTTHVTTAGTSSGSVSSEIKDAPLVFIGYGLRLPSRHMDDYAGIDLHGKVAVFYNTSPARLQGPQRAYARVAAQRWKYLSAAGAIGMIAITPPRTTAPATPPEDANPRTARAGGPPARNTMAIADPSLDTLPGIRINATVPVAQADAILAPSGHTMAELKPLIAAGKPLPAFPMNATLHAITAITQNPQIPTHNVVGLLEGSDPRLKHEYIVISAHLDHLGVGRAVKGDAIYNGAMDNASGVASVIETARILIAGPRPKRSILFIALTGEEMGELGSAYFAARPTVKKSDIVADLNMDMYLPLFPLRFLEVQGLGESSLGNDARAVCQLNDVEVQFDKQPDENRFIRSDQVNFVAQGIPALAFKFGWIPDSPEMKTFNDWVKTRYHQPSDDLDQPVDKAAAAQFDAILAQLTTRVANAPQRPAWYPESSFAHQ